MGGQSNQLSHAARAAQKDFNAAIIQVFQQALTDRKGKTENLRKEIENTKQNQMEILELTNIVNETSKTDTMTEQQSEGKED